MIHFFPNEEFKELVIDYKLRFNYAVSNYGRLISYTDKFETGNLLKGCNLNGYRILRYKFKDPKDGVYKNKDIFLYRKVAELFVPKTHEGQTEVIHLDHSLDNDFYKNLKWVTMEEAVIFRNQSPRVIQARIKIKEEGNRRTNCKLTDTQVILLKQKLLDPNRKTRYKILAKQFGVSEMQLYRIKSGENWGHIKVNVKPKKEQ